MSILATRSTPAAVTLKCRPDPSGPRQPHGQGCQLCFAERSTTTVANIRIGAACQRRLRAIAQGAGVSLELDS
jgi:hypothetical protein